jgi:transforming growth factor-beta-induced protein
MSRTSLRTAATALLAVGLVVAAPHAADARRAFPQNDLVETLERAGGFTTLLALLDATELTATVAGGGPFTIFAPTDDAFAKLPQETVDFLLANPDVLTEVLLYHVVDGRRSIGSLLRANTAETLLGEPVLVTFQHRGIFVNQSRVVRREIRAQNGIVHAIDTVLTPPEEPIEISSIVDVLRLDGRFGTLLTALEATGLDAALAGPGPLTLFAPTDDAFAALGEETIQALLADPAALTDILLYHVVDRELDALWLLIRRHVKTLQGDTVEVRFRRGGGLFVDDAKLLSPNVDAPNGVIHVIDGVLLPGQ